MAENTEMYLNSGTVKDPNDVATSVKNKFNMSIIVHNCDKSILSWNCNIYDKQIDDFRAFSWETTYLENTDCDTCTAISASTDVSTTKSQSLTSNADNKVNLSLVQACKILYNYLISDLKLFILGFEGNLNDDSTPFLEQNIRNGQLARVNLFGEDPKRGFEIAIIFGENSGGQVSMIKDIFEFFSCTITTSVQETIQNFYSKRGTIDLTNNMYKRWFLWKESTLVEKAALLAAQDHSKNQSVILLETGGESVNFFIEYKYDCYCTHSVESLESSWNRIKKEHQNMPGFSLQNIAVYIKNMRSGGGIKSGATPKVVKALKKFLLKIRKHINSINKAFGGQKPTIFVSGREEGSILFVLLSGIDTDIVFANVPSRTPMMKDTQEFVIHHDRYIIHKWLSKR